MTLRINVVTIFPEFFSGPLGLSIPSRAAAAGSVRYNIVDLREFTHDKHRTVDDYPYGGGAGMVMKPQPFHQMQRIGLLFTRLSLQDPRIAQRDGRRAKPELMSESGSELDTGP